MSPVDVLMRIIFDVLGPILLMVGFGALLRWRFRIDIATLSKLNIYVFVPGFVFHMVSNSTLDSTQMAGIMGVTTLNVLLLGGIVLLIGRAGRVNHRTVASVALATMF